MEFSSAAKEPIDRSGSAVAGPGRTPIVALIVRHGRDKDKITTGTLGGDGRTDSTLLLASSNTLVGMAVSSFTCRDKGAGKM